MFVFPGLFEAQFDERQHGESVEEPGGEAEEVYETVDVSRNHVSNREDCVEDERWRGSVFGNMNKGQNVRQVVLASGRKRQTTTGEARAVSGAEGGHHHADRYDEGGHTEHMISPGLSSAVWCCLRDENIKKVKVMVVSN